MQNELKLSDLKLDPKNPRVLSKEQYEKLERSLDEFGDLSNVIYNQRTGELVGGHMRTQIFLNKESDSKIQITQRFDQPTRTGTIGIGYIIQNGDMHGIRVVDWPIEKQRIANINANNAGGSNDIDMLTENLFEIQQLDNGSELLDLVAIDDDELKSLLGETTPEEPKESDPDKNRLTVNLNNEQYQTVENAIATLKASRNLQAEKNPDLDGSALAAICETFLSSQPQADII
jgi:hypothetical protein